MNKKSLSIIILLGISIISLIIWMKYFNNQSDIKNNTNNSWSIITTQFPETLTLIKDEIEKWLQNEPELSGKKINFEMIKNNEYEYSLLLKDNIEELWEINLNYFITPNWYNWWLLTNKELTQLWYTWINILNWTWEMLKLSEILKSQLTNSMIQYKDNTIEYKLQFSKNDEYENYKLSCYNTKMIDYTYEQEDNLWERCLLYKDKVLYWLTYSLNDKN